MSRVTMINWPIGTRFVTIIGCRQQGGGVRARDWELAFEGFASDSEVRTKAVSLLEQYAHVRVLAAKKLIAEFPQERSWPVCQQCGASIHPARLERHITKVHSPGVKKKRGRIKRHKAPRRQQKIVQRVEVSGGLPGLGKRR
jgi:hypothetical protein